MDTVQPTSVQADSQQVIFSLLSRTAVVLFFSAGSFLIFSRVPWLEWLTVALQLAISVYEIRKIWELRHDGLWTGFPVKLCLVVFIAASIGPVVAWFWLVAFRPPSTDVLAAVIGMVFMSALFLFYGGLLAASPELAYQLDSLALAEGGKTFHTSRWWGFRRRVAGLFLLAVGSLLVIGIVKLAIEEVFH